MNVPFPATRILQVLSRPFGSTHFFVWLRFSLQISTKNLNTVFLKKKKNCKIYLSVLASQQFRNTIIFLSFLCNGSLFLIWCSPNLGPHVRSKIRRFSHHETGCCKGWLSSSPDYTASFVRGLFFKLTGHQWSCWHKRVSLSALKLFLLV